MARLSKKWNDGSNDTLVATYEGASGTRSVTLTSAVNEGADRVMTITVSAPSKSVNVSVTQIGKREVLQAKGVELRDKNGNTLLALKNGIQL